MEVPAATGSLRKSKGHALPGMAKCKASWQHVRRSPAAPSPGSSFALYSPPPIKVLQKTKSNGKTWHHLEPAKCINLIFMFLDGNSNHLKII